MTYPIFLPWGLDIQHEEFVGPRHHFSVCWTKMLLHSTKVKTTYFTPECRYPYIKCLLLLSCIDFANLWYNTSNVTLGSGTCHAPLIFWCHTHMWTRKHMLWTDLLLTRMFLAIGSNLLGGVLYSRHCNYPIKPVLKHLLIRAPSAYVYYFSYPKKVGLCRKTRLYC